MLTRHIRESLQVTPGPFPDFWVGPGDEASCTTTSWTEVLSQSTQAEPAVNVPQAMWMEGTMSWVESLCSTHLFQSDFIKRVHRVFHSLCHYTSLVGTHTHLR